MFRKKGSSIYDFVKIEGFSEDFCQRRTSTFWYDWDLRYVSADLQQYFNLITI